MAPPRSVHDADEGQGAVDRDSDVGTLVARRVSVTFGAVRVLREVDLDARGGEVLGVIGPNGAGKTTLLNVLSGFERRHSGAVRLGEEDLTRRGPEHRARHGVARTFQAARLFPRLTVAENVEVFASTRLRRASARRAAVRELLDLGGLAELADVRAGALPQGLERVVAVVRSLALQPRFLLLDEPAAGLDDRESARMAEVIGGLPERFGCGVVLVEHDMALVMAVCDRIHVLDQGATLVVGTPAEVRGNSAVREAYLGPEPERSDP